MLYHTPCKYTLIWQDSKYHDSYLFDTKCLVTIDMWLNQNINVLESVTFYIFTTHNMGKHKVLMIRSGMLKKFPKRCNQNIHCTDTLTSFAFTVLFKQLLSKGKVAQTKWLGFRDFRGFAFIERDLILYVTFKYSFAVTRPLIHRIQDYLALHTQCDGARL